MFTDSTGTSRWTDFWKGVGNWFKENQVKIAIGATVIIVGAAVTFFTAGMGTAGLLAAGGALLASAKAVGISMAISAGIGFAMGGLTTGTWEGTLQGFGNGLADGFMLGGIMAGTSQILSGAFRFASLKGVPSGMKNGGKMIGNNVKILSPNSLTFKKEFGGTLIKFGNAARFDVGTKSLLHMHMAIFGKAHIPLGIILSSLGGGVWED